MKDQWKEILGLITFPIWWPFYVAFISAVAIILLIGVILEEICNKFDIEL